MAASHPRVVVFSSDPKEGRVISRHLKGGAFRVIRARDPADCSRYLKKDPDLVLLDLSIKESWRILRRAKNGKRNGHSRPQVVAFDHQRNPLKEIKAFHLGADGYVGRPEIKEELLSSVTPFVEGGRIAQRYERLLRKERGKIGRLEKEVHRLDDFTEKIASNVPISVIIVDPDMRITYVNRNFCRAMGKDPAGLVGRSLTQIFPETLYGPTELVEKAEQVIREGGPTPRFSMGYRGESYTYRVLPIRTRTKGEAPRQAMILIENVSEIRSLGERVKVGEEKFRTLFESSPDALLVTGPGGGRILESNRRAEKLLGKMGHHLGRRSLTGLFPPKSRRMMKRSLVGDALKNSFDLPDLMIPLSKEGNRILAVSASPTTRAGEPALLCVLRDMTEKRFLEAQVRQTEKMSLLGQFTAGAAHEINNPLAIISSHAQYLLSQLNGDKVRGKELTELRETLNLIDRESRFCGAIIKNLLAYTHTRELKKRPVDLGEVVNDSLKIIQHQLALSNITVLRRVEPGLSPVLGDATLLQQALMNLIWNAQAAMPKRGRLTIGATRVDGKVRLWVEDTGVGIPKENLERIFTPFFTTKEVGQGTGLGLWVVRSVVEEHQGQIEVRSDVGKGTSFTITLFPYEEKHEDSPHH